MMRKYWNILLILIFTLPLNAGFSAQEEEIIDPFLELFYTKNTDDEMWLKATLVYYVERQPVILDGQVVKFFAGEDSVIALGEAVTDDEGIAMLRVDTYPERAEDLDGVIRYFAEFEGNDTIYPTEMDTYIKDVNLKMVLEIVDSVKTVQAIATYDSEGEIIPAADEDIYFFVPRMFSDLPVGEEFLDEEGQITIEFPDDIPGDADGYLEVVARFDQHYLFGTVEKRERIQWGIPTKHEIPESYRALWTQIAPMWMIITLSIMLAGVWSHYIFVIIQLVRIRKIGKNLNKE
jgi:hypothetical protein